MQNLIIKNDISELLSIHFDFISYLFLILCYWWNMPSMLSPVGLATGFSSTWNVLRCLLIYCNLWSRDFAQKSLFSCGISWQLYIKSHSLSLPTLPSHSLPPSPFLFFSVVLSIIWKIYELSVYCLFGLVCSLLQFCYLNSIWAWCIGSISNYLLSEFVNAIYPFLTLKK